MEKMRRTGVLKFYRGTFSPKMQYKILFLKVAIIESPFQGGIWFAESSRKGDNEKHLPFKGGIW